MSLTSACNDVPSLCSFANDLYRDPGKRLCVNAASMVPAWVAFAVSLHREVSFNLRAFVWNSVFVNTIFTVYLAVFWSLKQSATYVTLYAPAGGLAARLANIRDVLSSWSTYSVVFSFIFLRYITYRAVTKGPERLGSTTVGTVVVCVSNMLSLGAAYAEHNRIVDAITQRALLISFIVALWLAECLLSLVSLRIVWRHATTKRTKAANGHDVDLKALLLFSVVPSLQLLPMTYASVSSIIDDMRRIRIAECISAIDGRIRGNDLIAALRKCSPDFMLDAGSNIVLDGSHVSWVLCTLENVSCVGAVICVLKPFLESCTILLLLPRFRNIMFREVAIRGKHLARRCGLGQKVGADGSVLWLRNAASSEG